METAEIYSKLTDLFRELFADDSIVLTPQTTPQAPQALGVLSAASQPLFGLPSQLPKPVEQLGLHTRLPALPVQEVVPFEFVH